LHPVGCYCREISGLFSFSLTLGKKFKICVKIKGLINFAKCGCTHSLLTIKRPEKLSENNGKCLAHNRNYEAHLLQNSWNFNSLLCLLFGVFSKYKVGRAYFVWSQVVMQKKIHSRYLGLKVRKDILKLWNPLPCFLFKTTDKSSLCPRQPDTNLKISRTWK
jgi:hypothetical protein